jgi:hypothetical protein
VEELQLLGEAWADRHRVLERSLTSSSSSSSASSSAATGSGKPAAGAGTSSSTNAHIRALSALFRHRDTSVDEKEVIEDRLEVCMHALTHSFCQKLAWMNEIVELQTREIVVAPNKK